MTDQPMVPVIGITTYRQDAVWRGGGPIVADVVPAEYARAVDAAGGAAVLLPPVASQAQAAAIARTLDGLILVGGADVNPALYGESPHPEVTTWYDDRDASELAFIREADERDLPVLGVCRGMQLLAVAHGGSLVQHLPEIIGNESHTGDESIVEYVGYETNTVTIEPGTRLGSLVPSTFDVSCFHHQTVREHPGFIATAYSTDGVLHAMEAEGDRFVIGVQWHPETRPDEGIFAGLIAAARAHAVALVA